MIASDTMLKSEDQFFKGVILEVIFFVSAVLLYSLPADLSTSAAPEPDAVVAVEDWISKSEIPLMVRFSLSSPSVNVFTRTEESRRREGSISSIRNPGLITLSGSKLSFLQPTMEVGLRT
uniref:Uncharacterized protein n=1 Tax=Physcomitrium patens TaxID=3218 RepID=A0A2K1JKG9_PHYPA|nr:hypothetical protein PHYPA_016901 [Physcomitrium patens]